MNKTVDEYNENLLKLVAEELGNERANEWIMQAEFDRNDPRYRITEEDRAAFAALRKRQRHQKFISKTWQRAAVIFAALLVTGISVSFSVSASRNAIISFFANISNGYVNVTGNHEYMGEYRPVNPPAGYELKNTDSTSDPKVITYYNGKSYVIYKEYMETDAINFAGGTKTKVNNKEAYLTDSAINWINDDVLCRIEFTDPNFNFSAFAETVRKNNG